MRYAIAVLALCTVPAIATEGQGAADSLPRVRAPVMFVMDTVLFRLPRADVDVSALMTPHSRPPEVRIYSRARLAPRALQIVDARCVEATGIGEFRVPLAPSVRTDSTRVYVLRPMSHPCVLQSGSP